MIFVIKHRINNIVPDETYLKNKYKKIFSKEADMKNPKLFTEKIQWIKLNDRKNIYTTCTDKLLVKDYIKEKLGSQYLIPLVFSTNDYKEISKKNLPDYPVVVKTTHDSNSTIMIYDKQNVNFKRIQDLLKKKLHRNYYEVDREWQYKNIKPKIIVEKLLKDDADSILNDYKIHCFHGKPMFIQTIFDRSTVIKENWYDINWNLLDVYYLASEKKYLKKPVLLNELLGIAELLSKDFAYVRVDLYISYGQIYFGELTFTPHSGFMKFTPRSLDLQLGNFLKLKDKSVK